jgi:hypothetical protein
MHFWSLLSDDEVNAILFSAGFASAVEKPRQGEDILLDTYHKENKMCGRKSGGIPNSVAAPC